MIFITIGTQAPFDRLIKAVDEIAVEINEPIIAQINRNSLYHPKHLKTYPFLSPQEFSSFVDEARLIVAHAGMGTIISALMKKKPIIVMPRMVKYREHRNDHQLSTIKKMHQYVHIANDENELKEMLLRKENIEVLGEINEFASSDLVNNIQEYILGKK